MQTLKSFFGAVFSRVVLLGATVLLLGAALWFAGPLLGVDGSRPLASAGARLVLVALLLLLALLWLADGPVAWILLPIACLLLWFAGPALSVGDARPLESATVRGGCVAATLLACATWGLYWLLVKVSQEPAYLRRLRLFRPADADEAARRTALAPVAAKVTHAMSQMRLLQAGGFWRRTFEKNRHLYALPWFLLIGPPGAGKTALLRQSGLQFPLARPAAAPGRGEAVATADCEWCLSNEAVLIDTAGRYCVAADPATGTVAGAEASAGTSRQADHEEWLGLLGLLRKRRPRAPVNGVVLAVSMADLLDDDEARRARQAAALRMRLSDIRRELGIRCPVYLLVTKADRLGGFSPFFQSLTSEGRTQVWGFTFDREAFDKAPGLLRSRSAEALAAQRESLRRQVQDELGRLAERIDAGLRIRLKEEFEAERRRALFALPQEFAALCEPLVRTIDEICLDSRFDDTQSRHALRGVYFCSAEQDVAVMAGLPADRQTLVRQLAAIVADTAGDAAPPGGTSVERSPHAHATATVAAPERQGFFLHDLLIRIVIPEAHLVRPNLRWEFRFRLLRTAGHGLALLVFGWLAVSLQQSGRNNRVYLDAVGVRTAELHARVAALAGRPRQSGAPAVLEAARGLPLQAGVSGATPPPHFGYGLYAAPPVLAEAVEVYMRLQEVMLLPGIVRRMESVLRQALQDGDSPLAYATLRAYLLLHDPARYATGGGAADVLAWVEDNLAADAEGPASTTAGATHLRALFSGLRHVQAASPADASLVRDARRFLDADATGERIYERAKVDMQADAPPDFSLIRAVGPQVGTALARRDNLPLESGVPGLFTHAGYHGLFDARLPAFVRKAEADDSWVMGRPEIPVDALLEDVRRRYLDEYSAQWTVFLESIRAAGAGRPAGTDELPGASLGFDLSVLRQLAAPDSPLTRLVRAAVRETTLSQASPAASEPAGDGRIGKPGPAATPGGAAAATAPTAPTGAAGVPAGRRLFDAAPRAAMDPHADRRVEKALVDNRFAALREVVTGQADATVDAVAGTAQRPGLEALTASVNDFYTRLVVADTALNAGGLPPGGNEVAARLTLEADKLPAPLREVLGALAREAGNRVAEGGAGILRKQAQVQFDRLVGLLAQTVGEPCRRGVEGRYPFAEPVAGVQDAAIEDVTRLFAAGGLADEYFRRYLAPLVDTSVHPWRYRSGADQPRASLVASAEAPSGPASGAVAGNAPTLVGELLKLLVRGGPDLEAFHRVQQIRDLFFFEGGGRALHWKLSLSVLELDPSITDLMIDIDGQGQRYMHGPVQPLAVDWPGPRGGSVASVTANPRISNASSVLSVSGPWALLHLLDKGRVMPSATAGRVSVEITFDGRRALLGIGAGSQPNPLNSDVLRGFRCPGVRSAVGTLA